MAEPAEAGASWLAPERLAAANINPVTRLATDYLNHFNNVVMLMEMVGDMPDFAAEIAEWRPAGYAAYFAASHFRQKDLAVAAFAAADPAVRAAFEAVVAALDAGVGLAQARLAGADPADPRLAADLRRLVRARLQPLIASAGAIINGAEPAVADAIDDPEIAQHSVDALFG